MSRRYRAPAALAFALAFASGCQDYNFNPVGHCLIQPGSERVTLSNVSTADVLFVVDDSGSMGAEQGELAANFTSFINSLDQANATRVSNGLEPFDFHIAVTSTSVFWNYAIDNATCSSSCAGNVGQLVCCLGNPGTPLLDPVACTPGVTQCPTGTTCGINCAQRKGESYCCDQSTGAYPAGALAAVVPCSRAGAQCGTMEKHYAFYSGCGAGDTRVAGGGVAVNQWPYPRGDFVSWTSGTAPGSTANPRVLHFDKELYTGTTNRQGFTRQELVAFFAGNGTTVGANVITGTCGSGEEQGLAAARLALEKAVAGQQKDTYKIDAGKQASWNPVTRTASSTAEWLHPNAKLVVVFVGDEDDCSSPEDPSGGIVMQGTDVPGSDACTRDPTTNPPIGHKLLPVVDPVNHTGFVDYLVSLGRPLGAAFIESASQTSCSGDQCTPGTCCQLNCPTAGVCGHDSTCGGQAAANRFFLAAGELRGRGVDVVQGSICDPDFGSLLGKIAEIVKPPSGLTLPTLPAESAITLLRIADSSGQTRKVCGRPLAPSAAYATLADAQATGADWWFTPKTDPSVPYQAPAPAAAGQIVPTRFVYINPRGSCIANPGETYSADYLGKVPTSGCGDDAGPGSGSAMCAQQLGGKPSDWTCYAGMANATQCAAPAWSATTQTGAGTCLCGANVCPNGYAP